MAKRGKNRAIDDADLLDAARPGERFDDEMDDRYDEQGERREASGALAEGEPVGPWTEEDEEPNAFDAASDSDSEFEEVDEEDDDLEFEALDGGSLGGVEPTEKRRREH